MADLSKDELRKEITAILKESDLKSTSSKKVRQQLEEKLDCSLQARKKEIDDLVMEYLSELPETKEKGSESEEAEEEEEEEEEEASEEEEKKPKKPAKREPAKKAAPKRKKASSEEDESASEEEEDDDSDGTWKAPAKKGKAAAGKKGKKAKKDDSDSDSDWGASEKKAASAKKKAGGGGGAKRGGGYTRPLKLSPVLAAVVGADQMARHEVVKKLWAVIKEKDLFDPKNKQFAICDDELFKVMGIKRFRCFAMMKYLKQHFLE